MSSATTVHTNYFFSSFAFVPVVLTLLLASIVYVSRSRSFYMYFCRLKWPGRVSWEVRTGFMYMVRRRRSIRPLVCDMPSVCPSILISLRRLSRSELDLELARYVARWLRERRAFEGFRTFRTSCEAACSTCGHISHEPLYRMERRRTQARRCKNSRSLLFVSTVGMVLGTNRACDLYEH